MALPSWLKVSPTSGNKNGTLSLVAAPHTGRESRSFTVTGTTGHGTKKNLSITQAAAEEQISVVGVFVDNTKLTPSADEVTINFKAKDSRTIRIYFKSNSATFKLVDGNEGLFYPNEAGDASLPAIRLYSCDIAKLETFPQDGTEVTVDGRDEWVNSNENLLLNGDPGAVAMCGYYMEISNIPEVKSETGGKIYDIHVANYDNSITSKGTIDIKFNQENGAKSYSVPVVKTFTYPEVPAAGLSGSQSIVPNITVQQTWGWNGDVTNGGTTDVSTFSYAYTSSTSGYAGWTLDKTTGKITNIASLGTVASDTRKLLDSVKVAVTANGVTSTAENVAEVYQKPNTVTSGVPIFNWDQNNAVTVETNTKVTVSFASGGTTLPLFNTSGLLHNITQVLNYASGASEALTLTASDFDSGLANQVCTLAVTNPVEGFTLNKDSISTSSVAVTENYDVTARNGFVVTITIDLNFKSIVATITFNQQAGGSTLTFNPTEVSFDAAGGTKEVQITSNDTWTITF